MIYQTDNSFVISSRQVWLPGSYADKRAANYAFRFPDEVLQRLQDEVNAKESDPNRRVITYEILKTIPTKSEEKK